MKSVTHNYLNVRRSVQSYTCSLFLISSRKLSYHWPRITVLISDGIIVFNLFNGCASMVKNSNRGCKHRSVGVAPRHFWHIKPNNNGDLSCLQLRCGLALVSRLRLDL